MLDKIKQILSSLYSNIVLILGAVVGILLYWINLKNKEAKALKARIELIDTERKADLLEVEIKDMLENRNLLKKELDDLNNSLVLLEKKREEIRLKNSNLTDKEVEEYWENQ